MVDIKNNENNKENTEVVQENKKNFSNVNGNIYVKCFFLFSFIILIGATFSFFSHYNDRLLFRFQEYFNKKAKKDSLKKDDGFTKGYKYYLLGIDNIVAVLTIIFWTYFIVSRIYKRNFLKENKARKEVEEENQDSFVNLLLEICNQDKKTDEIDIDSIRSEKNINNRENKKFIDYKYFKPHRMTFNFESVIRNRQDYFFKKIKEECTSHNRKSKIQRFIDDEKIRGDAFYEMTKIIRKNLKDLFKILITIKDSDLNFFYLNHQTNMTQRANDSNYPDSVENPVNIGIMRTLYQFCEIIAFCSFEKKHQIVNGFTINNITPKMEYIVFKYPSIKKIKGKIKEIAENIHTLNPENYCLSGEKIDLSKIERLEI